MQKLRERKPKTKTTKKGRVCTDKDCKKFKPWSEFYKSNRRGVPAYSAKCKDCHKKDNNKVVSHGSIIQHCALDRTLATLFIKFGFHKCIKY